VNTPARGPGNGEQRGRTGLERLRLVTQLFDRAFAIPGTKWRFGLDALLGLVPGLGDIAGALVAVYALRVARDLGAPNAVQLMMLTNIALDALVGAIPLVGDVFDFAFQAQTRNLALLEAWVSAPDRAARRSRRSLVLIPLAIIIVFATLTALAVWMLYILIHWLWTL
jgi:NAD/NADP transhydrogenase beta subunit